MCWQFWCQVFFYERCRTSHYSTSRKMPCNGRLGRKKNYCGLNILWNYREGWVEISMLNYIPKMLNKFNHWVHKSPQHASHKWNNPAYGKTIQYAPKSNNTTKLDKKGTTFIQQITGSVLYQARVLDPLTLVALTEIGTKKSKPTEATKKKTDILLDYCATYLNTKIRYYASDIWSCT